jgi:hypothetical protein
MERHNHNGFPLILDVDIPADAHMTRDEFIALLRRIVDAIGAPCLIYDACNPDGKKMSAHIVCRHIGFRTSAMARAYAEWMLEQVRVWLTTGLVPFRGVLFDVHKWVDTGIPKLNGQFKLPGNTKLEVGKRAQRPNHQLLRDLVPLTGSERYEEILSWEEFDANRPWFYREEAAAMLRWPVMEPKQRKGKDAGPLVGFLPAFSITHAALRAYYATWNWEVCRTRYGTLFPCYMDYWHMETVQREGGVKLVDREGDPLVTVRVAPDPERWLVFNIHEDKCGAHSRHDSCAACWTKVRARAVALLEKLGDHLVHVYYTGGNGVHIWLELRTAVERFAFAGAGARKLLGSMGPGRLARLPGALHERTGRMSEHIRRTLDFAPPRTGE